MSSGGGGLYLHEYGWLDNGNTRVGAVDCESGAIALGEGDKRFHVKQVVYDAATDLNNPAFGIRFLTREQPFTADTDTGLYTAIHDGLMDTRLSARSVRMRVEATADTTLAFGKPRLEVRPGGRR